MVIVADDGSCYGATIGDSGTDGSSLVTVGGILMLLGDIFSGAAWWCWYW